MFVTLKTTGTVLLNAFNGSVCYIKDKLFVTLKTKGAVLLNVFNGSFGLISVLRPFNTF